MVPKSILRPLTFPFTIFTSIPNSLFTKFQFPKPFSLSTKTLTLTQALNPKPYGPSLHKITIKPQFNKIQEQDNEENEINKDNFTRVYDISAIRVPSKDCFTLEERLRGHLLNWPRIRNIARVPGDDLEEQFKMLVIKENECLDDDTLNRRIYGKGEGDGENLSPVLYREELIKTFDSRGFVNFSNLAKISRPKRKKERVEEKGRIGIERNGKSDFAVVEVVEENGELSGLLGEEFKGGKWKGPTRLLLLDEGYASKGMEELPEAVKVVFC